MFLVMVWHGRRRLAATEERLAAMEEVQRFARAEPHRSRQSGGLGLGLAIVQAIAEAHGGPVRVRSTLGHGSVFEILLPLAPETVPVAAGQSQPSRANRHGYTALAAGCRRVADQMASGATNREAAAALFVSVRAVETHVRSIYRKLGVRTRSELRRTLASAPDA